MGSALRHWLTVGCLCACGLCGGCLPSDAKVCLPSDAKVYSLAEDKDYQRQKRQDETEATKQEQEYESADNG